MKYAATALYKSVIELVVAAAVVAYSILTSILLSHHVSQSKNPVSLNSMHVIILSVVLEALKISFYPLS